MKDRFDLTGKVAVITGGNGAIGSRIALRMAKAGCKVVIIGRDAGRIDKVVEQVRDHADSSIGIPCDVLDVGSLEVAHEEILKTLGSLDILINAAGGNIPGSTQLPDQTVFDLNITDVDKAIDLNLRGSIYPALIFGQSIARNGGSIVNISSMATYSAISRVMGYSVAKTGINSFTSWMACELATKFGDKVRVNAIAPGFFIGEQNRRLLLNEDGTFTERGQKVIDRTPMKRFGDLEELAGAVQFLCSDEASFITGVVLPIDGGFSSFSGI